MASTKGPKGDSSTITSTPAPVTPGRQRQNTLTQKTARQQQQQRPAGSNADGAASPGAPAKKNPKDMTKAERRELQERQRAAKAAATANANAPGGGGKGGAKSAQGNNNASASQPSARRSLGGAGGAVPDTPSRALHAAGADDTLGGGSGAQIRGLRIFSHFGTPKPVSSKASDVDRRAIHPVIIRLGLQFSGFKITGANARCIATLTAFKTVIQDYSTPLNTTLSRHLMTHLNPQINHLVSARPMAVTMGNAIRQLKLDISGIDIDMPEQDAKDLLCKKIDNYIRDRIIIADQVIQDTAFQKIKDGDTILTFARSSVVEKVLLHAHEEGKRIHVIVIDARPMLEGKRLLQTLTSHHIPCTYALLPSLPSLLLPTTRTSPLNAPSTSSASPSETSFLPSSTPSLVLLGAHAIHANGSAYARAGSALVALMGKERGVPVLVCAETYKFAEGVVLDGFGKNELAPSHLFQDTFPSSLLSTSQLQLEGQQNLEILNPLYDLTPPANIAAVVTEVGIIPPNSISSILLTLGRGVI